VSYQDLPSNGSVKVEYRINDVTAWTEIGTDTTDGSVRSTYIKDATTATLKQFKEVQFRLTSTGGAVITELSFDTEIVKDKSYN